MATFQANAAGSGLGGSTAEQAAEAIYAAATDGEDRLRYLIGADAEQLYAMRHEHGDDAFVAGIAQRMLS